MNIFLLNNAGGGLCRVVRGTGSRITFIPLRQFLVPGSRHCDLNRIIVKYKRKRPKFP
nr:MAG TPA: hypothetical protein [Caudoviricetes sp.]